eukprot:356990_1
MTSLVENFLTNSMSDSVEQIMWPTIKQQKSLIDGYCREQYYSNIPLVLIHTILQFYNEIFYWKFKGNKLKQFLSTEYKQLIQSQTLTANGIPFHYNIIPKGVNTATINQVCIRIYFQLPDNIEYLIAQAAIYNKKLNTSRHFTNKYKKHEPDSACVFVDFSKCTNMTEIDFCFKLNLLRIQPNDIQKNKSLLFYQKDIQINKHVIIKWDFSKELIRKLSLEFSDKNIKKYKTLHHRFGKNDV